MNINLFCLPDEMPSDELFEPLIPDNGVLIERIISNGQSSPPGFWYCQDRDEWVAVLQGRAGIQWENGGVQYLEKGDCLLIPAGQKHRVEYTSCEPPCIWLAVHGKLC